MDTASALCSKGHIFLRHKIGNQKSDAKPDNNAAYNYLIMTLAKTSSAAGKLSYDVKKDIKIQMLAISNDDLLRLQPNAKEDEGTPYGYSPFLTGTKLTADDMDTLFEPPGASGSNHL